MKLLSLLPSEQRGGTEEYALVLTTAAVQQGWDVHVAFPQRDGTASLIDDVVRQGSTYHPIELQEFGNRRLENPRRHVLRLLRTLWLLNQLKPDVVQINLPYPNRCLASILACALLNIPTLVVFHLVARRDPIRTVLKKAYGWARSRNQQWISISENNRQLICQLFQADPQDILTIYNGAKRVPDCTTAEEQQAMRQQVREELGLPPSSQIALTVGRLDTQKGHVFLIPALPHLAKDFPDLQFVWIGDGNRRDELVNLLGTYGVTDRVHLLGYRSDVPRFLKAADLFVFPTLFEGGQSFAIAEAMAQGLPIVTSDASGIPEVIEHGLHGLVCRTADSCDLLENIRWALRHPQLMEEMAEQAKRRANDFSQEKMVQQLLEVLIRISRTDNLGREGVELAPPPFQIQ